MVHGRQIGVRFSCAGGGVGNFFTGTASPSPHRQRVDFDAAVHGRRHVMVVLLRKSAKKADKRCGIPSNENSENTWNHDHDGTETGRYQYVGGTVRSESAPTHDPKTCHRAGNGGETRENRWGNILLAEREKPSADGTASKNRRSFKSFQYKDFNPGLAFRTLFFLDSNIAFQSKSIRIDSVSSAHGAKSRTNTRHRYATGTADTGLAYWCRFLCHRRTPQMRAVNAQPFATE